MDKTLLFLLLLATPVMAEMPSITTSFRDNIEVDELTPNAEWPRGTIIWKFAGRWPAAKTKAIRKAMCRHPELQEGDCAVAVLYWKGEKQTAWGLLPHVYGIVTYTTYIREEEGLIPQIIACNAVYNASVLRHLGKEAVTAIADKFALKILHSYAGGKRER